MAETNTTIDAFHKGRFVLVQPKSGGHRAGVDAMLLAACVPDGFDGHLADLGAGAGAAGLAVLSRCEKARACLFELSESMTDLARKTLAHQDNAHLAARANVFHADITANGETRAKNGLPANNFDWVIANPPFNESDDRKSPHSERAFAHVMDGMTIELWSRTAASICKPGGYFAMILRPQSMGEVLAGYMGRFGGVRIIPVHPREGEDAIRILVVGKKGSKQKLEIAAPIFLHKDQTRDFTDQAEALINGVRAL